LNNRSDYFDIIVSHIKKELNPRLIYIFGSFAKNRQNSDSDIDIAFLCDTKIDLTVLYNLQLSLGAIAKRDVDLIDMSDIDIPFKVEIISSHYPVFSFSEAFRLEFEMNLLSKYQKLNEEREVIFAKRLNLSGEQLWKLF